MSLPDSMIKHLNRRHGGAYTLPDGNSAKFTGDIDAQLFDELMRSAVASKCEVKMVNGALAVTQPNWIPNISALKVVTDNFDRADGAPGSNWNQMVTDGGVAINSNHVKAAITNGHAGAYWNSTFSDHQYSQMVMGNVDLATGDFIGPAVRCKNNMNDFYTMMFFNVSGGGGADWEIWLYKRVAGGFAGAGGGFLAMGQQKLLYHPAAGDVFRLEVTGNIVAGYVNGVLKIVAYDTDVPSGGSPGVFFFQAVNAIYGDNFEGGELNYTPPGQVAAVTDDFSSGAVVPNIHWAGVPDGVGGFPTVSSGQVGAVNTTACGAVWIAGDFANNQASQIAVRATGNNSGWVGVTVRDNGATNSNYLAIYFGNIIALYRTDAGAFTQLGSNYTVPGGFVAGDILRLEVTGTTLTVKRNGTAVITQTDATYASGRAGFRVVQPGNLGANWRGESL